MPSSLFDLRQGRDRHRFEPRHEYSQSEQTTEAEIDDVDFMTPGMVDAFVKE